MTYKLGMLDQGGIEAIHIETLNNGFVVSFEHSRDSIVLERQYFKEFSEVINYLCDILRVEYTIDFKEIKK